MSTGARRDPGAPGGQVYTFYSYKGGTGRTMALANAAVLLASRSAEPVDTLMVDWDLEAPGLHKYFPLRADRQPMADPTRPGLADLFETLFTGARELTTLSEFERRARVLELVNALELEQYISQTDVPGLSLLKAGRLDGGYSDQVNRFRWDEFYDWAPWAFRALMERLILKYRYVLVDSRTGITDTSSICTSLLPDKLVVVFTPNEQSLEGVRTLVERTVTHRHESDDLRPLVVYPLPSRIEEAEPTERDAWRLGASARGLVGWQRLFESTLIEAYQVPRCNLTEYFDEVQIRHNSHYAYGEKVAVRIDRGTEVSSLPQTYTRFVKWLVERASPWESAEEAAARQARALGRRAESVYLALESDEQRELAHHLFLRLVKAQGREEVGDFGLRIAALPEFAHDAQAMGAIISRFEEQGLLRREHTSAGRDHPQGTETVQLHSEMLLTAWPRLHEWMHEARAFLLWRQRLSLQVDAWLDSGRNQDLLLRTYSLNEALDWRRHHASDLNAAELDFIRASEEQENTRETKETTLTSIPVQARPQPAAAAAGPVPALPPAAEPFAARPVAAEPFAPHPARPAAPAPKRLPMVAAGGALVVLGVVATALWLGHPQEHASLIVAATRLSNDPAQTALLLAALDDRDSPSSLERAREVAASHLPSAVFPLPGAITSAAVNARGTWIVATTSRGNAYLRSVQAEGGRLLQLPVSDAVRGSFSPDGRALLIARRDGSLLVLSDTVADDSPQWQPGRRTSVVQAGDQTVGAALTSERSLLTINRGGAFTEWQRSGCCTWTARPPRVRSNAIRAAAFSADGSTVGIDVARGFQLWSTQTTSAPILTRDASLRLLALSASGTYVSALTQDSTAVVWDQIGPTIWQQRGTDAASLAVDGRGERVAFGTNDRARVLSIRGGAKSANDSLDLRTPGPVSAVFFAGDSTLITASDSTLRVWPLYRPLPSPGASWTELRSYFVTATQACLTVQDRQSLLAESTDEAQRKFTDCANRLGLVAQPVVAANPDSGRTTAAPTPGRGSTEAPRPVPNPGADSIDVSPLLNGDEKVWTGEWSRGEGRAVPVQFRLTFKGETVSGRVSWVPATNEQQQVQQAARGAQPVELAVSGSFDRRRREIRLYTIRGALTDPADIRLLIIDRTLRLRGNITTGDKQLSPVSATLR